MPAIIMTLPHVFPPTSCVCTPTTSYSQDDVHATMLIEAAATTGLALFVGLTLGLATDGSVYMRDDKAFPVEEVCLVYCS